MCTAIAAQSILDALQARTKNASVFTAYDVTVDARDRTKENISHLDVRHVVHNEWNTGQFPVGYNREEFCSLDLAPGQPMAIMYYPDGKSPSDHPQVSDQSAPAPVASNIPTSSAPVASAARKGGQVKDGSDIICSVTAEGRINIPDRFLSQVRALGGTYDVKFSGSVLYKAPNADGRVRIRKSELGGGDTFRIAVDVPSNTITVEPA